MLARQSAYRAKLVIDGELIIETEFALMRVSKHYKILAYYLFDDEKAYFRFLYDGAVPDLRL